MKSVGQLSHYVSLGTLEAPKQDPSTKLSEQSPYLRAILSEKKASGSAKVLSIANSTMAAALRYIANSSKPSVPGKLITPAW